MKTKTQQHTPTPQELHLRAVLSDKDYSPERIEEIVRAVNSHEALLEALKKGEDIISGLEASADRVGVDLTEVRHWWANVAGKAIAQAEGRE